MEVGMIKLKGLSLMTVKKNTVNEKNERFVLVEVNKSEDFRVNINERYLIFKS